VPDDERWIDLHDPDDAQLSAALPDDVHVTAMERLRAPARHDDEPRPRLEAHGSYVFGVLVVPALDHDGVVGQEINLVATPTRLVTIRKTPPGRAPCEFDDVRAAALHSNATVGVCLYLLVDEIAERFLSIVDRFDDMIDELEDNAAVWDALTVRKRISETRHDILHVRRVLAPTRDAARAVLDDRVELDTTTLFPRDVELRFADAYDKLLRATDGLDLSRDLLAGVRDYHQAQVANDQNEVMKRLTVVASVLLLPTFIVGLYGQNVRGAPELHWSHGYLFSWALIVVTTFLQLWYFRRKKWI
jgi:magnesium transporter